MTKEQADEIIRLLTELNETAGVGVALITTVLVIIAFIVLLILIGVFK